MYYENPPLPPNRNITTRDIADAINELVERRINIYDKIIALQLADLYPNGDAQIVRDDANKQIAEARDQCELLIRRIADGLK